MVQFSLETPLAAQVHDITQALGFGMGVPVSRPLPQHSHPGPALSSSDVQVLNLLAPTEATKTNATQGR